MAYESNEQKIESVYSKRIRAGKRRTYFFDVRATRSNDYFLTITESRKRFNDNGYDRHKIFLYKEDFNKFIKALNEAVDYVKTDLMPNFDFDAFNHDNYEENQPVAEAAVVEMEQEVSIPTMPTELSEVVTSGSMPSVNHSTEEVDKW
ncbi:MAG: PUR family DNA/RNA-binding protein [Bacteroidota bacterium]|nr:PUR family DNA/RNA-binding protein [Bacteroidota bacterium]